MNDGAPSTQELQKATERKREHPTMPRNAPKEGKQSLGLGKGAHAPFQGQVRTLMASLKQHYGFRAAPSEKLVPWLVRHVGWQLTRCRVQGDGRTAWRKMTGKDYDHEAREFGEQATSKDEKKHDNELEERFMKGVWVGKLERSDAHVFLTPLRGRNARTAHTRPERDKWAKKLLEPCRGSPRKTLGLKAHDEAGLKTALLPGRLRRRYTTKATAKVLGATDGCEARTDNAATHSETCRSRMEKTQDEEDEKEKQQKGDEEKAAPEEEKQQGSGGMAHPRMPEMRRQGRERRSWLARWTPGRRKARKEEIVWTRRGRSGRMMRPRAPSTPWTSSSPRRKKRSRRSR